MTWNRRANKKSGGSWQDDSWENQINQDSWNKWQGAQADSDDREAGATSSWGNQSNCKEPQSRSGHGHGSGYGSHGHGCSSWQEQEEDWWNSSKPQEDWQNSHEPQEEDWWNSSKPQEDWQNSREPQEEDWWNSSKPQEDWRKSQRSQASGQRHTGGQQTSQAWSGYSARGSADPWHAYGKNDQHSQDNWKEDPWAGWNNQSGQNGNDWSKSAQDNWKEDPWAGWNNQSGQNGNDWSKSTQDNWKEDNWKEDPWAGNEQSGQNGNDWSNSAQAWGQDKWNAVERWGDKLKEVDWQERPQVNIRKNFYEECANEAALSRTPEEVERIRQSHFIEIFDGCSDEHPVPNVINSFDEACFSPKMMASLRERFEEPTPIQKQIWPLAMQGRDVVGIAETGSGKTVAYLLPMICHIVYQEELQPGDGPVALILTPTRELAKQIQEQCELFGSLNGLKSCTVVGGTPSSEQKEHLQGKNDIVVATPGRFMTALGEEWVMLNRATYVVLDEADEMLKKEFYEQIKLILSQVRKERQVLMFSATWPEEVRILAQEICTDSDGMPPVFVRIGGDKLAACKDIEQHTVLVDGDEDKYDKLKERLQSPDTFKDGGKAIIFCRTRGAVMRLHEQLEKEEFMWKDGESLVAMLHGEMRQSDRDWAMLQFRQGDLPCVISTGVLARGHDIPKVRFVFNYDVPREAEDYIHRVGRTGRAGAKGYSMIFVDKSNSKELQAAHAFLMGVLQATDQTVEEDFKEAVENYEQSQNQTFYGDGAGWDGWDVEDTKHEAADGDAAQEQWPEGTQGTEWQGGATEGAYAAAEEEAGWQQEAAGGDAAHAAQEQWSESNQWQAQYEQWPEGTQWQEQCEQWPEGTQGTLWQGGATEGAYAAAEEEAGWQQEAAGGDAAHAAQEKWPESTQWQGVTTEDAHAAAEAAEGDAAQQKGVTTEDAHAAAEAAEGDAAQQKGVATEDAHAAAEAQAEASLEASQEAAEGDAAQQKGETTEDAHAAAEEHWPEGTQGREWQGGTTEGGHDAAEEQQQWQGSAWQATVADATQEKEHWQGYYAPWQGGTTEGAYTSAEEPWQSHTQWQQAHQWNQWQQEQTFTPAVDVEIVSPPFTLGEDDAVKQQNATVGQEGDEGTWWEEAGERPSEGIEHENIPETCPVISIDKDPSAQQKDADPSLEQKETSDEKVTEEDPSAQQKDADPSLEQKETSDEKVTEEVEKESTAASAWQ